jgi:predicted acetyltransferase
VATLTTEQVQQERGVNLPSPNHVSSTFLFAFVGDRIVGRASIRHSLNEFLQRVGGHIGYVVVPEFDDKAMPPTSSRPWSVDRISTSRYAATGSS